MGSLSVLSEDQLILRALVGRGGTASVYEVHGYDGGMLFKKYDQPRDPAGMSQLIAIMSQSDADVQAVLRASLAWPDRMVTSEDGQLSGVLIPKARQAFVAHLTVGPPRLRDLNYLLYEERAARVGVVPLPLVKKLRIVTALARVLSLLQGLGLVYEDLAAQNVLWTTDPAPDVFLLDCDSLRKVDSQPGDALYTTADWTDPRVLSGQVRRPDHASVAYGLGLLLIRTLNSPTWHPSTDALEGIEGMQMVPTPLRKILAGSLRRQLPRPTLERWIEALDEAIDSALPTEVQTSPPRVALLRRATLGGWQFQTKARLAMTIGVLCGVAAGIAAMLAWR